MNQRRATLLVLLALASVLFASCHAGRTASSLAAANALSSPTQTTTVNAEALQTADEAGDRARSLIRGQDGQPPNVVSATRETFGEIVTTQTQEEWHQSMSADPDTTVWMIELSDATVEHSCPQGTPEEFCRWDHVAVLLNAQNGKLVSMRILPSLETPTPAP
jgi:hypothetical protein